MWWLNMFSSSGGDSVCAYAEGICTDREAVGCTALYPPARAWLSHLEAHIHTHAALFLLAGTCSTYCLYHIIALTPVKSSELRLQQIEPLHPLPHWHAHIPLFHPHLLQILLFPHIFLVNTGSWLLKCGGGKNLNKNILYILCLCRI